jgi:hypothetical protein
LLCMHLQDVFTPTIQLLQSHNVCTNASAEQVIRVSIT